MTDQATPAVEKTDAPAAPVKPALKPKLGPAKPVEAPKPSHPVPSSPAKGGYWWGTGRRKTAVARVRIKVGTGKFTVNGRTIEQFFTEPQHQNMVQLPLKAANLTNIDVFAKCEGGGFTGQAGAVLLGLARAVKLYDANSEPALRDGSMLSTDSRQVERKKYGRSGARRRFQFSKR